MVTVRPHRWCPGPSCTVRLCMRARNEARATWTWEPRDAVEGGDGAIRPRAAWACRASGMQGGAISTLPRPAGLGGGLLSRTRCAAERQGSSVGTCKRCDDTTDAQAFRRIGWGASPRVAGCLRDGNSRSVLPWPGFAPTRVGAFLWGGRARRTSGLAHAPYAVYGCCTRH